MPPARPHYLCTTGCLNAAKLPAAPDRVCCERPEVCKTDSHVLHFLSRSSFYCSRGPGVSYPPTPPSHDSRSARQKTWWSRSELPLCFPRRNSAEKASGIVWHGTTSAFPNDLKWWNFFVGEGGGKKKKKNSQPTREASNLARINCLDFGLRLTQALSLRTPCALCPPVMPGKQCTGLCEWVLEYFVYIAYN